MFTIGTGSDVYRKDNLAFDFRLILALSRSDDDIDNGGERPEGMFRNPSLKEFENSFTHRLRVVFSSAGTCWNECMIVQPPPPPKKKSRISDAWFAGTHWRHILYFIGIFSVFFASSDLPPPGAVLGH